MTRYIPDGGAGGDGEGGGFTDAFSVNIRAGDSNTAPTDDSTFNLALTLNDTSVAPTETAQLSFPSGNFGDSSAVPTDDRSMAVRVWATGSTDNDSSRTAPTNANGQNDGTFSDVTTNQTLGDLTNPVTLTTAAFAGVPSGTWSSKLLRVYFNIPARTTTLDTLTLRYDIGGGLVTVYTHSGTAAVNHNAGTFTVDLSALSVAQLQALVFSANYLAAVVAVPETVINLDAVAIELVGTL